MPITAPNATLPRRTASFHGDLEMLAGLILDNRKEAFFFNSQPVIRSVGRQALKTRDPHQEDAMHQAILVLILRRWNGVCDFVANAGDDVDAAALPPGKRLAKKLGYLAKDARDEVLAEATWKGRREASLHFENDAGPDDNPPPQGPAAMLPAPDKEAEEADWHLQMAKRLNTTDSAASSAALRASCHFALARVISSEGQKKVPLTSTQRDFHFANGTHTLGQVITSFHEDYKAKRNLVGMFYGGKNDVTDDLDRNVDKRNLFAKANDLVAYLGSDEDIACRFGLSGSDKQNKDTIQQWRRQSLLFFQGQARQAA